MSADYFRRKYTVEGEDLDKAKHIELSIAVDGKTIVKVQAREPGMVAFVSRESEQGFDVELIEVGGRHVDRVLPSGPDSLPLEDWQKVALGVANG